LFNSAYFEKSYEAQKLPSVVPITSFYISWHQSHSALLLV